MTILERQQRGSAAAAPVVERAQPTREGTVPPVVRDRYLDVLVTLCLVQVVTLHAFGWDWLPLVFPAVAVLFGVAGAHVAGSLDRAGHRPWGVLRRRALRLLPPLWVLGLVLVPLMLEKEGWRPTQGLPFDVAALLNWLVPLGDPAATEWGRALTSPLWYVRGYLWFLLLSPAFLWMFRRWPRRTTALPLATVVLAGLGVFDLGGGADPTGTALAIMATFGVCWMIGFAHHDGTIARLPWPVVLALSLGLVGLAVVRTNVTGVTLREDVLAAALYCLGFVLLLLRPRPPSAWIRRRRAVDRVATGFSRRSVTIYIWAGPATHLAGSVVAGGGAPTGRVDSALATYLLAWLLLGAVVVAVGWVEDLGARRRPTILPATDTRPDDDESSRVLRRPPEQSHRLRTRIVAGALAVAAGAVWWRSDAHGPLPEPPGDRPLEVPESGVLLGWPGGDDGEAYGPRGRRSRSGDAAGVDHSTPRLDSRSFASRQTAGPWAPGASPGVTLLRAENVKRPPTAWSSASGTPARTRSEKHARTEPRATASRPSDRRRERTEPPSPKKPTATRTARRHSAPEAVRTRSRPTLRREPTHASTRQPAPRPEAGPPPRPRDGAGAPHRPGRPTPKHAPRRPRRP